MNEATEIDTVVIGGGQAGLAMSHSLRARGRDHVILEKQEHVGAAWRQRWDSFTLVTPNWQLRLPGHAYAGDDPDGFLQRDEVVAYLEKYAASFDPPLRFGTEATAITPAPGGRGYLVESTTGAIAASNVVVATGTFQRPHVPTASHRLPPGVEQLHSAEYRNPADIPDGAVLVVGASQSGSQIARELHDSGRRVYLSVGRIGRLPRRYRGRDGMWWALQLGLFDESVDQLDSPDERFVPNPLISGNDGGRDINLHEFARNGIVLLGRLADVRDGRAVFAPDLHERLAGADRMASELRKGVDALIAEHDLDLPEERVAEPRDGYEQDAVAELDLAAAGIRTIIWATGYRWDYSWIDLPILDPHGYPRQQRGVTEHPGLYFIGLHWLHTRKSGLLLGVGEDARHVAAHIAGRAE